MTNTWPTPDEIAAKYLRGKTLTAWEISVYRLNFRPDGSRYSNDPKERDAQYEDDIRKVRYTVIRGDGRVVRVSVPESE